LTRCFDTAKWGEEVEVSSLSMAAIDEMRLAGDPRQRMGRSDPA
jgi:hypothetical protein